MCTAGCCSSVCIDKLADTGSMKMGSVSVKELFGYDHDHVYAYGRYGYQQYGHDTWVCAQRFWIAWICCASKSRIWVACIGCMGISSMVWSVWVSVVWMWVVCVGCRRMRSTESSLDSVECGLDGIESRLGCVERFSTVPVLWFVIPCEWVWEVWGQA